jgi:hypothetical protein
MNILNITNMKKSYIDFAKEKLQNHKSDGIQSSLSIFQVAELIDVITGKREEHSVINAVMFSQIGVN